MRFLALLCVLSVLSLGCGSQTGDNSSSGSDHTSDAMSNLPPAFTADEVRAAAQNVRFSKTSSSELADSDVLAYYDAVGLPKVSERFTKPTILGEVKILESGVDIAEPRAILRPGTYYHWIGKKDGVWIAGFSSVSGSDSFATGVRFAVEGERPHSHLETYVHDPDEAAEWRSQTQAMAATPGTRTPPGTIPRNPGGTTRNPGGTTRNPGGTTRNPDGTRSTPTPYRPPRHRCIYKWKPVWSVDHSMELCSITEWVQANQ